MFKASVYCAFTTTLAMIVLAFMEDPAPLELSWELIFGMATAAGLLWVVGFAICRVLLLPLMPLFMRGSLPFSFAVFILIGFAVPALAELWLGQMSLYGEVPRLFEPDNGRAVCRIWLHGMVGILGAASAWMSLKHDTTTVRVRT